MHRLLHSEKDLRTYSHPYFLSHFLSLSHSHPCSEHPLPFHHCHSLPLYLQLMLVMFPHAFLQFPMPVPFPHSRMLFPVIPLPYLHCTFHTYPYTLTLTHQHTLLTPHHHCLSHTHLNCPPPHNHNLFTHTFYTPYIYHYVSPFYLSSSQPAQHTMTSPDTTSKPTKSLTLSLQPHSLPQLPAISLNNPPLHTLRPVTPPLSQILTYSVTIQ